jgi:hypothetical protein
MGVWPRKIMVMELLAIKGGQLPHFPLSEKGQYVLFHFTLVVIF